MFVHYSAANGECPTHTKHQKLGANLIFWAIGLFGFWVLGLLGFRASGLRAFVYLATSYAYKGVFLSLEENTTNYQRPLVG